MTLALDHFFILTDQPEKAGDSLLSMGMKESFSRDHEGQGTSNRRFEFSNGMLEILYVRDSDEADEGPARDCRFPTRVLEPDASPFGLIFRRQAASGLEMPFAGWKYQPAYFSSPRAFHVGSNSEFLEEPLCIYAPFIELKERKMEEGLFRSISQVRVSVPVASLSETLLALGSVEGLIIERGNEHLMAVTFDNGRHGLSKDLRPTLPLIIDW